MAYKLNDTTYINTKYIYFSFSKNIVYFCMFKLKIIIIISGVRNIFFIVKINKILME